MYRDTDRVFVVFGDSLETTAASRVCSDENKNKTRDRPCHHHVDEDVKFMRVLFQ
jgi:hypothetical protein